MAKDKGKKAGKDESKKGKGGGKPSAFSDGFAKPSEAKGGGGDGWSFTTDEHIGELFIVTPTERRENVPTDYGTAEVIVCDVVHVNRKKPGKSEVHEDVYVFAKWIIGALRDSVGKARVLGVLAQGEAKKGQSAPWLLDDASASDETAAREALAAIDPFAGGKG